MTMEMTVEMTTSAPMKASTIRMPSSRSMPAGPRARRPSRYKIVTSLVEVLLKK